VITTVTGVVAKHELGFCQFHEHVMVRRGVPAQLDAALCAQDEEKSGQEVADFSRAGGRTLVDAQPIGCGRMPAELAHISRQTGVHIVASTGFHVRRFYPVSHWLFEAPQEELENLFRFELTQGMYEDADRSMAGAVTEYRAGIIKAACEDGPLDSVQRRLFSAAAYAAMDSNVPIMIHVDRGSDPVTLFHFLTKLGMPPQKLVFCHLDRAMPDQTTARQLCKEGAMLELDTIGRFKYHSDEDEIKIIFDLLDAGFENQILLSLDTTSRRMRTYGGGIGLTYLIETFLPMLKREGLSSELIYTIMVDNPSRILETDRY